MVLDYTAVPKVEADVLPTVTLLLTPCGDLHPEGGGDGDVDVLDALRTLKIAVGLVVPTPREMIAGDVGQRTGPRR